MGISEDDILELIGKPVSSIVAKKKEKETSVPFKDCIKCNRAILTSMHICPHCHTFVGDNEITSLIQDAALEAIEQQQNQPNNE